MPVNPNWNRWIKASVASYFKTISASFNIPLVFEGTEKNTAQDQDYFEFRMNGPIYKEETNNQFRVDICINILVTSKRDLNDFYRHETNIGKITTAFNEAIPIYKMGSEAGDDPTALVDCLILNKMGDRTITVQEIGQIDSQSLATQAAIEGCYRVFLDS